MHELLKRTDRDILHDVARELEWDTRVRPTEIASAVRWALERDVAAPVSQIQSPVSQGTVVLEGVVAFWSQRADAESAVEHVPGVRRVVNRIAIEPARRHRPQTGPWSG